MVINLPKWPITSHLHWTQKKTTTSDVGPSPDLERAQKCDEVELVNGTQTPLLITGSPTEIYIHVYTNDIKKTPQIRFHSKTTYHHKNGWQQKNVAGSKNAMEIFCKLKLKMQFLWILFGMKNCN